MILGASSHGILDLGSLSLFFFVLFLEVENSSVD